MGKNKRILLFIIFAIALFLIPSICNGAVINATETTTTSTGKTVKWSYELEGESIIRLKCINKEAISGRVEIPSTIDGYTVVDLSEGYSTGIFKDCIGLTQVKIPDTVIKVGHHTFNGCSSLTRVELPNGIISIGACAFQNTALTEIEVPDTVINIEEAAFRNCASLNNIILHSGLTSLGKEVFAGTAITSITIPDSVTNLGEGAFKNCAALKNITLSKNLTGINKAVFAECKGLTSIVIPDGVTTIASGEWYNNEGAFYNCVGLTKILIPDSVTTIEDHAFQGCNKLTIYGNDNQESKRYAEANEINFNYIENWDNPNAGDDVTPPVLSELEIENSSLFEYDEGTEYFLASVGTNISIKAIFEEQIYGENAPTLTIKCGNGEKIEITNGVIQGEYIIYNYTIKEQDKGIISAVSMAGGDIKDEAGNEIDEYLCPELVTKDLIWSKYVYANGTGSTTGSGGNGNTVTLLSIAITKAPTKTTYTAGEKFDKTGMEITATYSDGTTKTITNYSVSTEEALKTADTKVVITYTENGVTKTVDQTIEVKEKTTGTNNGGSGTSTGNGSSGEKDPTTKDDSKLPQTGATVLSLALVGLITVAAISKMKYKKYENI